MSEDMVAWDDAKTDNMIVNERETILGSLIIRGSFNMVEKGLVGTKEEVCARFREDS
jgi:hypothetical protein